MRVGDRVRSTSDGQIGFLVEGDDGRLQVLLDRPQEQRKVPYQAHQWVLDEGVKLTPLQIARVVHDADRALELILGAYGRKDWTQLKDQERHAWMNGVPGSASEVRKRLAAAVEAELRRK